MPSAVHLDLLLRFLYLGEISMSSSDYMPFLECAKMLEMNALFENVKKETVAPSMMMMQHQEEAEEIEFVNEEEEEEDAESPRDDGGDLVIDETQVHKPNWLRIEFIMFLGTCS
jgi:hypothetical protein